MLRDISFSGWTDARPTGDQLCRRSAANAVAETARALVGARNRWLYPDDLVDWVPEVARGFPARPVPKSSTAGHITEKADPYDTKRHTWGPEGAWLDNLHNALDNAVASAYGWPATIEPTEALAKLLELDQHENRLTHSVS